MQLTATVTFNYEIPEEDWNMIYDDETIGIRAENVFLVGMIENTYPEPVEIQNLEVRLVNREEGVVTQQPLDMEDIDD